MNNRIILLFIVVILSFGLIACNADSNTDELSVSSANAQQNDSIYVLDNAIVYEGDITVEGVEQVKKLYSEDITKLVITSKAGDMYAGIDLGEFIFDNKLDVEVKDYAFSVAANYVVTAANTLHLYKDSVIGFNGGISVISREDAKLEREFFNKIGIELQITSLGLKENFASVADGKDGFTYTIDALDKLGVRNINLVDGEWGSPSNDKLNLFSINRDEFYSTQYMEYENSPEQPPIEYSVTIEGNSIVYDGEVSSKGLEEIKDLYTDNIDRLVINSPGGEINVGMDFGEFIFDNKLDVEVRDLAFSSAANYIITAANTLYLNEDSVIGWHGGATQEIDSPEVQEGGAFYEYNQDSIKRETEFYKKIGVDQKITVYGQEERFLEKAMEIGAFGWTYDIATLKEMGLENIEFVDKEWTPNVTLNFMDNSFPLLLIDDLG